jgi:phospholipid transport system substrate-binding protein
MSATGKQTADVKPLQMKPAQNEVTVKTVVNEPRKEPVTIDYRMEKSADGWKVFDVVVADLSLVTTYRSTYSNEINRPGIDGLIKVIDDKNRSLAKG